MRVPPEVAFVATAMTKQRRTSASLVGKTVVLTGATSGVGLNAAARLARGGASLVLVGRNETKLDAVRRGLLGSGAMQVDAVTADFARLDDVRAAARIIGERHERIDVLINNAGVHRTTRQLSADGHELVFAVNHLASFLLTRLLLDRVTASSPARIIQVNSEGHRFGGLDLDDLAWQRRRYAGLKAYGASKVAQLLTVWELARRLEGTGVTINAMHPGAVRSAIGLDNPGFYRWWQGVVMQRLLAPTDIAGEALYYLAASPDVAAVSGTFFNRTVPEVPMPHAVDRALGERVWALGEKLTGLA